MRAVIQRVKKASVHIDGTQVSAIARGFVVLLGVEEEDNMVDLNYLSAKICAMRVFADADGKMNLSLNDVAGELLIVSQFTLHASTKKGNRPSFIKAARPEKAIPLYEAFIHECGKLVAKPIQTGRFGAEMQVELINDGPVTIIVDSRNKE